MLKNWMLALASHYEKTRLRYPHQKLLILFDIDGTIFDMRYMVWHLLKTYDQTHNTPYFNQLKITDITVHENDISELITQSTIPLESQTDILSWYEDQAWSSEAILESHRPFRGVLEVIRWFQMQPNTEVGLNTARPESLRADTLRSLNKLGEEYKVAFSSELLYMKPDDWPGSSPEAKMVGVQYFRHKGYQVFAFIDNEPDNLQGIAQIDLMHEILLLHADTIFQSKRTKLPNRAIGGNIYNLVELISPNILPRHIRFVWDEIDDKMNMNQFLASQIQWGTFDIQLDPFGHHFISRRKPFRQNVLQRDEAWLTLDDVLLTAKNSTKGLKFNLNIDWDLIRPFLACIDSYGIPEDRLWFNARMTNLQGYGFKQIIKAYPKATIECPIDFLAPIIRTDPAKAKELLDMFRNWGVSCFSVSWNMPNIEEFFNQMELWGFEMNIYNVADLNQFLQAVLLRPRSITCNFNTPKWDYLGENNYYWVFNKSLSVPHVSSR